MSRLTRDGTAEPVSRDQILRHARGQGNIHFPCSADHEQDWQPYPVDPYSAICDDHTLTTANRPPRCCARQGIYIVCSIESAVQSSLQATALLCTRQMGSRAGADSMGEKIVLQHSVFACFQGERDHFWPFVFFSKNICQLNFLLEGKQLG